METYKPVKYAYNVFEPVTGTDESLSPIIFLHSYSFSKEFWNDIPQIISDRTRRRSYAVDARDHGDSEWSDIYSFSTLVRDLNYFMDTMNIPKAILIGHSQGGYAAGVFALEQPERVEMLFIEDIHMGKLTKSLIETTVLFSGLWQKAIQSIPKEKEGIEARKHAVDFLFSNLTPTNEKLVSKRERLYESNLPIKRLQDGTYDVKHNMELLGKQSDPENFCYYTDKVSKVATYVIYGTLSNMKVKQHEGNIRERFPFVKMIPFIGATHYVHVDFPEKFIETVVKYIQNHSPQK